MKRSEADTNWIYLAIDYRHMFEVGSHTIAYGDHHERLTEAPVCRFLQGCPYIHTKDFYKDICPATVHLALE